MIRLQHPISGRVIETDDPDQALVWSEAAWLILEDDAEPDTEPGNPADENPADVEPDEADAEAAAIADTLALGNAPTPTGDDLPSAP